MPNEEELETLFASRGYEIVSPETLSIDDQIILFRDARRIAGTAGSALHMALFCRPEARVTVIDWRLEMHRTQLLIEAATGVHATHIHLPEVGSDGSHAPFIDVAAVREALDQVELTT